VGFTQSGEPEHVDEALNHEWW
jgi:hypothetical protein